MLSTERQLLRVYREMRDSLSEDRPYLIEDVLTHLGNRSCALGSAILATPFILPVSLGPLTAPASLAVILLGGQLARGREKPWLPERVRRLAIPQAVLRLMLGTMERAYRNRRRLGRERLTGLVDGRVGQIVCGWALVVGAITLAVPAPAIPLQNAFPAAGIVLCALGWSRRDGVLTLWGYGSIAVGIVYTILVFALIAWLGYEAVHAFVVNIIGFGS